MPINTSSSPDGKTVTIAVTGRFDFNLHRQFREAYQSHKQEDTEFNVDLAGTEFMDSSALGALLLLREHAGGDAARISLKGCRPPIAKILKIANFQRLFQVEEAAA